LALSDWSAELRVLQASLGMEGDDARGWMKEPEFEAAYRAARRSAFGQSTSRVAYGVLYWLS
jgi:hypothetical protein